MNELYKKDGKLIKDIISNYAKNTDHNKKNYNDNIQYYRNGNVKKYS